MFNLDSCAWPGCGRHTTDMSRHHRPRCFCHEGALVPAICRYLQENKRIADLIAPNMSFEGMKLENREFINCYFHRSSWKNCSFKGSRFEMIFMDEAYMEGCNFSNIHMRQSMLAASTILDTNWEDSDLISINWNQGRIKNCSFKNSDLYYSRFIDSSIKDSDFSDCNLRRVDFCHARLKRLNFKYSNREEAYFLRGNRS